MKRTHWVVLITMGLAACGGETEWQGTVRDSAGVSIVENTSAGLWAPGDAWTLTEELKIGSLEDEHYQFGQIGFLTVGADGAIYVLDAQAQHVLAYDAAGEYLRTIGQPGGGPGELAPGATFLLMGPGDTLVVPDLGNQRVNLYDASGASIGSFPLSLQQGIPMAWRGTSAGVIAKQTRPLNLPDAPNTDSMDLVVAQNLDGSIRDTLMTFRSGGTFNFGGGTPQIKLFAAEPIWTIDDGLAVYYGVNDAYRISVYENGDLARILSKPFTQRPVTDANQDQVLDALEGLWRGAGVPPTQIQQLRSIVQFGETFPAFASLQAGPSGTLWVQHIRDLTTMTDAERENFNLLEDTGAPDWDVFDSEGRYLGIVTMPDRFAPRFFSGDKLYGVWRDDLDVQYVMRLRIDRPVETD